MSRFPTPDVCARDVMDAVPLVMRFVRGQMRRRGALSVSVPQFRALNFVNRHPGTSLADVAAHLGVTPATASVIVDRLVRRGLIVRTSDPRERRRVVLTLTRLGTRRFAAARSATRRRMARHFAGMSPAQLRTVSAASGLLARVFREVTRDGVEPAGR
jgi:DNA-binding MarR family transcriptional regulator